MKKGFTLIELLVTIVIIALLGGVGVASYQIFFNSGEEKYYSSLESSILLAGSDYFTDHRNLLPNDNQFSKISITELVNDKYIETIKDSKGNECTDGDVYIYKDKEKNSYMYEVCLRCEGRSPRGKYCSGEQDYNIQVTAMTKDTHKAYNATTSYNSAVYANDENVLVTFTITDTRVKVVRYEVINSKTNDKKIYQAQNNAATDEVEESGTYQVVAYDESESKISSTYFNVKIARQGPKFSIVGAGKFSISKEECNSKGTTEVKFTIVKDNVNEEYKTIEYRIIPYGTDAGSVAYTPLTGLEISKQMGSGSYTLEVVVTNFADTRSSGEDPKRKTTHTKNFDVSYLADVVFDDNKYDGLDNTHEVVKGRAYNYLKTLPTKKNNVDIRWLRNNQSGISNLETRWAQGTDRMSGTTIVSNSCTHTIVGMMRTTVNVVNFATYCTNPTYNGNKQSIVSGHPTNVAFSEYEYTDAGPHTVTASIDSSNYIWNDETFQDKEFTCNIVKAPATLTCADRTYTGSAQNLYTAATGCNNVTNGTQTNAGGPWTLTCVADNNHYAPATCQAKMNKANSTTTINGLTATSGTTTYGTNVTASVSSTGDGTIGCTSSNETYAKCSYSNGTLTIIPQAAASNGSSVITVTRAAGNNYNSSSATYTITVNRQLINCTTGGGFLDSPKIESYNGSQKCASSYTCPTHSTGKVACGITAGDYKTNCTADAGYYFASDCEASSLTIEKAGCTCAFKQSWETMNVGDTKNLEARCVADYDSSVTATGTIEYESKDTSFFTYSDGVVTAKKAGTAKAVYAKKSSVNFNRCTVSRIITVNEGTVCEYVYRVRRYNCAGAYQDSEGVTGSSYSYESSCNSAINSTSLCGTMCSCSCVRLCSKN